MDAAAAKTMQERPLSRPAAGDSGRPEQRGSRSASRLLLCVRLCVRLCARARVFGCAMHSVYARGVPARLAYAGALRGDAHEWGSIVTSGWVGFLCDTSAGHWGLARAAAGRIAAPGGGASFL